jgi:PleD family two-component response regulator
MDAEVLIADPDPASRAALADLLGTLARVRKVASAADMVRAAGETAFAAILVDVNLPESSGLDAIRQLRALAASRDVPVLLLAQERHAERHGYALGAVDYLVKPIDAAALRAKVEVLLTLFRRGVELRQRDAALEQALASVKLRDLYMGVLGHDLRSSLGAISIAARMMLMRGSLGPEDKDSVFRIARNADRMAALIRDILD